jgi:hypothetical protein
MRLIIEARLVDGESEPVEEGDGVLAVFERPDPLGGLRCGLEAQRQPLDGAGHRLQQNDLEEPAAVVVRVCQRTARTERRVVHPLSKALTRRVTSELEYLQGKWAAHLPYRQASES